jgi:FMN phosphatase YigB (HAD superfamily)
MDSTIRLASFDVFDTLLTRAVGSPESVFLALGRRLWAHRIISCSPQAFAAARTEAERRAYSNARGECQLVAIHDELRSALRLTPSQASEALRAEYAVERALTRSVPGASDRIRIARAQGYRIAFVSDTYFPADYVRGELARHGLWAEGDTCVASCEAGMSKRSGKLFPAVLSAAAIPARRACHVGNSRDDDISAARACGLEARPFFDGNLNELERLLESHAADTDGLASAMAGAARLARLSTPASDSREGRLRDVAAAVAAPTLVGYMLWVLRRAQQLGLRRLYFVSRDGQILLEIARRLSSALHIDCDLRYLYASRQAWNLAGVTSGDPEQLAWIWDTTDFLSVTSLFARVAVEPQQVQESLASAGFGPAEWNRVVTVDERTRLRDVFLSEPVRLRIQALAHARRSMLSTYLQQEHVFEPEPWGLVDLGWYGSLQNTLSSIIRDAHATQPVGLYFALFRGEVVDTCASAREAYFFDERKRSGYLNVVPDIIPLMEMFCAGDHGTVVDFQTRNGRIVPVLKEQVNQPVIDWGLPLFRRTVIAFTDSLTLDHELVDVWANVRPATVEVLRAFWTRPSGEVARAWSGFPWEDGLGLQTYRAPLARPYGWRDAFWATLHGRVKPHHRAGWLAGSLAISSPGVRFWLARIIQGRRVWRRLRFRRKTEIPSNCRTSGGN